MPLGVPMVDIYQSDPSLRILELMVFAIGSDIHIGSLPDRFIDKFSPRTTASSNGFNGTFRRTRVSHVRTI